MSGRRRLAILDDFQGVALANGDWTKVAAAFEIDVFRDWLPPGEERARAPSEPEAAQTWSPAPSLPVSAHF